MIVENYVVANKVDIDVDIDVEKKLNENEIIQRIRDEHDFENEKKDFEIFVELYKNEITKTKHDKTTKKNIDKTIHTSSSFQFEFEKFIILIDEFFIFQHLSRFFFKFF